MPNAQLTTMRWLRPRQGRHRYLVDLPDHFSRDSMQRRLRDDAVPPSEASRTLPATPLSPARRRLLMLCLLVGFFFSLLDTTIVSTSLLASSSDLKDFRDGSWVVLAYLLSFMGLSTVLAKLSDIYGRLRILLVSWLLFAVFSVACGCAEDMVQLIVCRALQGIGGAGLYSLTTIALPEIGPADKPKVIGPLIAITLSLSLILGPILGGLIPQFATWRWIYWMNAPFCLVTTTTLAFLYPREDLHVSRASSLRRIDFLGGLLLLTATVLLIFALQQAGSLTFAWDSMPIVTTLGVSAVSFVLFFSWQTWISLAGRQVEPIFPFRLAARRVYLACLVTKTLVGYVYLSLVLTLPERFQIVNDDNYWAAGVHMFPMLGGTALGCFINGPINAKVNRTSLVSVVSCMLILVGASLFNTLRDADTDIRAQYGFQVVFGLGVGLYFSAATMMSVAQAPKGDHAVAQGAIAQARVLGGAIGLAVATIILNDHVRDELTGKLTQDQLEILYQSPIGLVRRNPELRGAIRDVYAQAFATMIKVVTLVSAAALFISLFTLERRPPPITGSLPSSKIVPSGPSTSDVELDDMASDQSVADSVELAIPASVLRAAAGGRCTFALEFRRNT